MKKEDVFSLIQLLFAPILVILLGLVLVFNPDSASALISKVVGWVMIAFGIGFGISAITHQVGQVGKGFGAVILVVAGGWLVNNPLVLAAWLGRIIGILLVIDGIQDMFHLRKAGKRFLLPLIVTVVGVVLVAMPMATSRIVFILCGIVVLISGFAMLLDRLKNRRPKASKDDIIDAL